MALKKDMGVAPGLRESISVRDKALSGDMRFVCTPATVSTPAKNNAAFTRQVAVEIQTLAGEIHDWFNGAFAASLAVGDTASLGTLSCSATIATFTNGRCDVTLAGSLGTYSAGDTDTLTVSLATIMGYGLASKTSVETFT